VLGKDMDRFAGEYLQTDSFVAIYPGYFINPDDSPHLAAG